ncbi:MAG: tetratricopeptide repeat protein, partial [Burkholderiales bacterium]|nr:tetratricopeptide repeat protein [Burkholderiales bacterium]
LAAGRVDDALKEARDVQKARPKEAIGFAMEGDVLATQKKFAEAAKAYEEGFKRQPANGLVIKQHQLLAAAGQSAQADAVAAKWLKENPKDPAVRLYLADVELRKKDYRAAARYYREAIAIQPDNALALNNLAWVTNELKEPAAMGYAEKAYGLAPGNAAIADTYGWLLFGKGDTKRAVEILGKAAAAAPNAAEIRLHYAQALIKSGDKAAAKKELDAIVALGEKSQFKSEAEQLLKGL